MSERSINGEWKGNKFFYFLTLTYEDRKAIDWVGHRYFHGSDLRALLFKCETEPPDADLKEVEPWRQRCDVKFFIPEHIAWEIKDGINEETNDFEESMSCFAGELQEKFIKFCDGIV